MRNCILILLPFLISCTDTTRKEPESYKAGFKTIHTVDKSRIYKPKTDTTDYLHYRPIDLDIWYPSNHANRYAAFGPGLIGSVGKSCELL